MRWNKKLEIITHLAFWALLFSLFISTTSQFFPIEKSLALSSAAVLLMAGVAYANIFLIIPQFFEKRKFGIYLLSLIGLLVVVTFIHFNFSELFISEMSPKFPNLPDRPDMPVAFKEHMNPRFRFVPMFFMNITILFISTIYQLAKKFVEKERQQNILEKEKIKHELNFLRSQINPHFLFNALNNLHAAVQFIPEKASDYIIKLGDMLRYILEDCTLEEVRLTDEINYIQHYIFFQQQKEEDLIKVNFEITGSAPDAYFIEPMLLIPLVENAFKHSYVSNMEKQWINIYLNLKNNILTFSVKNNIGDRLKTKKESFGVGLQNIRRRLELLYPQHFTLKNKKTEKAYFAELTISKKL
ncbi:MAG: histidine kinase [Bacteroidota bacterium]